MINLHLDYMQVMRQGNDSDLLMIV